MNDLVLIGSGRSLEFDMNDLVLIRIRGGSFCISLG